MKRKIFMISKITQDNFQMQWNMYMQVITNKNIKKTNYQKLKILQKKLYISSGNN